MPPGAPPPSGRAASARRRRAATGARGPGGRCGAVRVMRGATLALGALQLLGLALVLLAGPALPGAAAQAPPQPPAPMGRKKLDKVRVTPRNPKASRAKWFITSPIVMALHWPSSLMLICATQALAFRLRLGLPGPLNPKPSTNPLLIHHVGNCARDHEPLLRVLDRDLMTN